MSEAKEGLRGRAARAAQGAPRITRNFVVAASGENVVMIDAGSGRSWALASDAGHPVWQPIGFKGNAEKAPKGFGKDEE